MKKILYVITVFLCVCFSIKAQTTKNLAHLTKQEYELQIEKCTNLAYEELGYSDVQSTYYETTITYDLSLIHI